MILACSYPWQYNRLLCNCAYTFLRDPKHLAIYLVKWSWHEAFYFLHRSSRAPKLINWLKSCSKVVFPILLNFEVVKTSRYFFSRRDATPAAAAAATVSDSMIQKRVIFKYFWKKKLGLKRLLRSPAVPTNRLITRSRVQIPVYCN